MELLSKKAQTATEYLIILAVVIVIALIVVGVMRGVPGIGTGGKSGVANAYWSTAPIGITQAGIAQTGPDTIVLQNNKGVTVTVTGIAFGATSVLGSSITLEPGDSLPVASANNLNCTAGNSYSFAVVINYTEPGTGSSYTQSGDTYEGTCAN